MSRKHTHARREFQPGFYRCHAIGCGTPVARTRAADIFCGEHWALLPPDVQRLVERSYRERFVDRNRWTGEFERVTDLAQAELLSLERCGYRIPQPVPFDF